MKHECKKSVLATDKED